MDKWLKADAIDSDCRFLSKVDLIQISFQGLLAIVFEVGTLVPFGESS